MNVIGAQPHEEVGRPPEAISHCTTTPRHPDRNTAATRTLPAREDAPVRGGTTIMIRFGTGLTAMAVVGLLAHTPLPVILCAMAIITVVVCWVIADAGRTERLAVLIHAIRPSGQRAATASHRGTPGHLGEECLRGRQ
jgi:hypothetical protein